MTSRGPFLCYRELIPPTCTDLSAFFKSQGDGDEASLYLITCTSSTINIYNTRATDNGGESYKFALLLSTKVYGKPQDLAIHRHKVATERDDIILSFDCGKFIILNYNVLTNCLDLLRTFNAEDQAIGLGSDVRASYHCRSQTIGIGALPILTVDNTQSIACSVLYGSQIFVMPLPSCADQIILQSQLQDKSNGSTRTVNPLNAPISTMSDLIRQREKDRDVMKKLGSSGQFVVDIAASLQIVGPILDVCFVDGYNRPTLAVLVESGLVTPGHVKQVRHTCSLYYLGINMSSKMLSIIWKQENLPHDSLRIYPLKSNHQNLSSGVILTSLNALLVITPNRENGVIAIATNGFATTSLHADFHLQPSNLKMGLELDSSQWICPDPHNFVGVLKNGVLLQLRINTYDRTVVATNNIQLDLNIIGCGNILASCIASHSYGDQHLWFVGSRHSDNILFSVAKNEVTADLNANSLSNIRSPSGARPGSTKGIGSTPAMKRQRRQSRGDVGEVAVVNGQGAEDMELLESHYLTAAEEDALLYTESLDLTAVTNDCLYEYSVSVSDSIPVLGPILSTSIVRPDDCFDRIEAVDWIGGNEGNEKSDNYPNISTSSIISDWECKDTVLLSAGLNENASFYRVANGIRLSKLTTKFFNGATAVATLSSHDNSYQLLFLSYNIPTSQTKVFHLSYSGGLRGDGDQPPQLSSKEISSDLTGFLSSSTTLAVGRVTSSLVVQVFAKGLRLVKIPSISYDSEEGEPLQDLLIAESEENGGLGGTIDENIVSADIMFGWVAVATTCENVYLFQYEARDESLILRRVGKKLEAASSEPPRDYFERLSGDNASDEHGDSESSNRDSKTYFSILAAPVHVSLFQGYFPDPNKITRSILSVTSLESSGLASNNNQVEEEYLYGDILSEEKDLTPVINGDFDSSTTMDFGSSNEAQESTISPEEELEPSDSDSSTLLLIVSDSSGVVSFYHVLSGKLYFRTALLEMMPPTILMPGQSTDPLGNNRQPSKGIVQSPFLSRNVSDSSGSSTLSSDRRLIAARMEWLKPSDDAPESLHTLCLVGLMDTGVTVVFKAVWNGVPSKQRTLQSFVKISTTHVSFRKRSRHFKARRNIHALGNHLQPLAPGQSEENEDIKALQLLRSQDINGRTTIIVCGNYRPSVVCNDSGLPQLHALGFPEVPYGNSGNCAIAPLSIGDTIGGFVSLWTENGVGSSFSRGQATLAFYQEVNSTSIANSFVTARRVKSGMTVHRSVEILKKTEEKNELAMLEKKISILSCSQDVVVPFAIDLEGSRTSGTKVDVAAEESGDVVKSETDFVYFFNNLESFCSPNIEIGPAPTMLEKQYRVAVLQGSSIVDEYHLLDNERIVDIDVVYLPVEVLSVIPNSKITTKKVLRRVFIVVATTSLDKHGEDTPADGRLLLFALEHTLTPITSNKQPASVKVEPMLNGDAMMVDANQTIASELVDGVSSQPTEMQMKPKLSLLSTMVGPASIVRQLGDSFVLATIGPIVYVYRLDSTTMKLEQIAFYFSKFFITTVSIIKNYIIIADALHNVQLLVWREEDWILMLVSKDYSNTVSRAVSFISDGASMGLLVGDDEGNVQLLQYDPKRELESAKGARLLCIADFHLGSEITCLSLHSTISMTAMSIGVSSNPPAPVAKALLLPPAITVGGTSGLAAPPPPPPPPRAPRPVSFTGGSNKSPRNGRGGIGSQSLLAFGGRMVKSSSPRTCLIGGTMDGAVGIFIPVDERIFKRLNLLQHIMSMAVESICAMNPKDYRLFKSSRFRLEKKKGILDGTVLWRFVSLDAATQDYLAASMGTSVGTILENLQEMDLATQFF